MNMLIKMAVTVQLNGSCAARLGRRIAATYVIAEPLGWRAWYWLFAAGDQNLNIVPTSGPLSLKASRLPPSR